MFARVALLAAAAASAAPSGCDQMFGKDDPKPGDDLGTFHVTGNLASNSCGAGALGSTNTWEFDVELARGNGALYWDNGAEIITGALAEDGMAFTFDTGVVMDMRTELTPGPPCTVNRHDLATGTLSAAGADVPSFAGQMSYDFIPATGSYCDDLVDGPTPLVLALPCGFVYQIQAQRTAAPE